jgi:hypothetical protein
VRGDVSKLGASFAGAGRALADFLPLLPAEQKIVAELAFGEFDRLGDGLRPESPDLERVVRAALLRFLLLGGDETCRPHEKGVRVSGAWIAGPLDLEGCRVPRDIGLKDCRFEAVPVLRSAVIDNLFLDGSALPGLQAGQLEARGSVTLRGASVTGEIDLAGARLGGALECDGADLLRPGGVALDAHGLQAAAILLRGATVSGGVVLMGARLTSEFDAIGATIARPEAVALNADGLEAGGDAVLQGATVTGETRFMGARIGGDLDCAGASLGEPGGFALRLDRAVIAGAFFLRHGARVHGVLDMTAADIGAFHDDQAGWPAKGDLALNRARYGAFIGGPVDAESRLDWLSRQTPERWGQDFWPQPYEQLASVFRDMGHDEDANAVLIAKERLQRQARRARAKNPWLRRALAVKDAILAVTLRYGRQPLLALLWLGFFWLFGVAVFAFAESRGAFKPNSAVVLRSPEWTLCTAPVGEQRFLSATNSFAPGRRMEGQTQLACFRAQTEAVSFPEFNPWMYSLDSLLPVLEIGQKQFWRPDPAKDWGSFAINVYYLQTLIGWALSLLAVAGFSGLVKSR